MLYSNLDNKLTTAQKNDIEKAEKRDDIVSEAVKEAALRGGDTFKLATEEDIDAGRTSVDATFDELAKSERDLAQEPFLKQVPLIVTEKSNRGWVWGVPSERHQGLIDERRLCPNCLVKQAYNPDKTRCEWEKPGTSEILGCGYSFVFDESFGWK